MLFRFSLAVAIIAAATGCAESRFVGRPGLTVVQQTALPPPLATDLVSPPSPQVLGPFDQLSVEVFGLPELSRTVTIDRSGQVSLPLIGPLEASGRTPVELAGDVTERLRENYVRDPQVTVNVTQVVSQVVTVDGQVRQPGLYPVTGRMSLMRAVARAQGTTDMARENYVLVFRRVNNQDLVAVHDLRAIRQGIYEDPEVYANDIVHVSESRARRLFGTLLGTAGLLTGPLIAILQ